MEIQDGLYTLSMMGGSSTGVAVSTQLVVCFTRLDRPFVPFMPRSVSRLSSSKSARIRVPGGR